MDMKSREEKVRPRFERAFGVDLGLEWTRVFAELDAVDLLIAEAEENSRKALAELKRLRAGT